MQSRIKALSGFDWLDLIFWSFMLVSIIAFAIGVAATVLNPKSPPAYDVNLTNGGHTVLWQVYESAGSICGKQESGKTICYPLIAVESWRER